MSKFIPYTVSQFNAMRPALEKSLTAALEQEKKDCALPDLGGNPKSDLWSDLPEVDSKTVAKLSPVVKGLIGRRLNPRWIRKGGYPSIKAAVQDLLMQIAKHCVADTPAIAPAKPATANATT